MNDYKKEFLNIFKELTRSRNTLEVWKDFVDMALSMQYLLWALCRYESYSFRNSAYRRPNHSR